LTDFNYVYIWYFVSNVSIFYEATHYAEMHENERKVRIPFADRQLGFQFKAC